MSRKEAAGPFEWGPGEIVDLTGRVAVVTGASSGLGAVVARVLARHGASVVMGVRDVSKGEAVRVGFGEAPAGRTEVRELDLFELDSVRRFAERLLRSHGALDVLVNNAGVGNEPHRLSREGVEGIFAVNVLGHFALTAHLLPALERRADARVVSVSSLLYHRVRAALPLENDGTDQPALRRYAAAKLGNLLFALELERRLREAGSPVRSLAAHPGVAATPMAERQAENAAQRLLGRIVHLAVGRSAADGAIPLLFAATAPEAPTGVLLGPGLRKGDRRVHAEPIRAPADDRELAQGLWRFCEQRAG